MYSQYQATPGTGPYIQYRCADLWLDITDDAMFELELKKYQRDGQTQIGDLVTASFQGNCGGVTRTDQYDPELPELEWYHRPAWENWYPYYKTALDELEPKTNGGDKLLLASRGVDCDCEYSYEELQPFAQEWIWREPVYTYDEETGEETLITEGYWERPPGIPDTVTVTIAGATDCECMKGGGGYGPDLKYAGYNVNGSYELNLYVPTGAPGDTDESSAVRWEKVIPVSGASLTYYTVPGSPSTNETDGLCAGTPHDGFGGQPAAKKINYRWTDGNESVNVTAGYLYNPGAQYDPYFLGSVSLFSAYRACYKGPEAPYKDPALDDIYCGYYEGGGGGLAAWGGYCYVDLGGDDAP